MSGLITKEFLYVAKQKKIFLVILVIYAVFFAALNEKNHVPAELATVVALFVVILTVMLTINTFAYDETAKWDIFVRGLPVSVMQIVGARYIFTATFSAAGAVFVSVAYLIFCGGKASPQTLALFVAGTGGIPLLLCCILIPMFYKLGLQKARLAAVVVFLLPTIFINVLSKVGFVFSAAQGILILKLFPAIILAVMCLSFLLSCKIYRHKKI